MSFIVFVVPFLGFLGIFESHALHSASIRIHVKLADMFAKWVKIMGSILPLLVLLRSCMRMLAQRLSAVMCIPKTLVLALAEDCMVLSGEGRVYEDQGEEQRLHEKDRYCDMDRHGTKLDPQHAYILISSEGRKPLMYGSDPGIAQSFRANVCTSSLLHKSISSATPYICWYDPFHHIVH